jgi:hypothetical protein
MAENNRVLNFSEFGNKYNKESAQDIAASYSEFTGAADQFQDGFDDTTYDDGGQPGPKRPIEGGNEDSPAQPGEEGTPKYNTDHTEGMEAPREGGSEGNGEAQYEPYEGDGGGSAAGSEYTDEPDTQTADVEEIETADVEEIETADVEGDGEGDGDPEAGDTDDDDDDDDNDDDNDDDVDESRKFKFNHNGSRIILESFDDFERESRSVEYNTPSSGRAGGYEEILNDISIDDEDADMEIHMADHEDAPGEEEGDGCSVICKSCGATKQVAQDVFPMGQEAQDDPDSWWQGAKMGMMCEGCM